MAQGDVLKLEKALVCVGNRVSFMHNYGKLSGTSLLTNKVSRVTLIINHLPEQHKESERD